jgi:hypothetical protein
MTAYKDDKLKAYAGWSMNVSSILRINEPIGDVMNETPVVATTTSNSTFHTRNRLRF